MSVLVPVRWICRHCTAAHEWRWSRLDVMEGPITMHCEWCGGQSEVVLREVERAFVGEVPHGV